MNLCIEETPVESNIYRRQNDEVYNTDPSEFFKLIGRDDVAFKLSSIGITKLCDLVGHKLRDWIDFDDIDDEDLVGIHCCLLEMGLKCDEQVVHEAPTENYYL